MKKVFLLLSLLLLFGSVFAGSAVGEAKYEKATCEADFAKANANNVIEVVSSSSSTLSPLITAVDNNLSALSDYVDEMSDSNKTQLDMLNKYMGSFMFSVQNLNKTTQNEFRNGMKTLDGNTRKETMDGMKADFASLKATFLVCKIEALKKLSLAKVDAFNQILSAWEAKMATFQSKGLDTTGMEAIIADAQSQVIDPMTAAINAGDSNASKDYCLMNGCNKVNFHFAAKMEAAKLEAIIAKVNASTTDQNVLTITAEAQKNVDDAQAELATIGNNKYQQGKDKVWEKLTTASNDLRKVIKSSDVNAPKPPAPMPPAPNTGAPDVNDQEGGSLQ
jgi:hypothetical protein